MIDEAEFQLDWIQKAKQSQILFAGRQRSDLKGEIIAFTAGTITSGGRYPEQPIQLNASVSTTAK
jgi:hypothetical protein